MKQPDLYYFQTIKMMSQAWSKFTENTRLWLVFSIQNLTGLVTSFYHFKIVKMRPFYQIRAVLIDLPSCQPLFVNINQL